MNVLQVFYTHSRGGNLYCHWLYLCSRSSPLDVEGFWIELALTVVRLDRIWRLVSEMLLYLAALHHQVMCHGLFVLRVFLLILSFSLYLLYWPVRQLNTCSSFCPALTSTMNSRVKSAVYISWKVIVFLQRYAERSVYSLTILCAGTKFELLNCTCTQFHLHYFHN